MDNGIVNAFFTFLGAMIGGAIGSIGTAFTLRYNYRELYAKTISESRNRWIDLFRENISVMLAEADACMNVTNCQLQSKASNVICCDRDKHYLKFCKAKNRILIRMNETENEHNLLQASLMELDAALYYHEKTKFLKLRELILIQTRHILKAEWERVKNEARGKQK